MTGETLPPRLGKLPLLWQIFLPNAIVLATAVAILALSPVAVSSRISVKEAIEILLALGAIVLVNLILIRRTLAPLERLTETMSRVDPLSPGQRAATSDGSAETAKLAEVFNEMLDRLETERRESGGRMLSAQERERVRLARELHDEIGQSLTGLMLELDRVGKQAPPALRQELVEAREAIRGISDELGEIVRRLRPEALDDLGLRNALVALTERFQEQTAVSVKLTLERELPSLDAEAELVLYRVAQEALTNVARHSGADRVRIDLSRVDGGVRLRVVDAGMGLGDSVPGSGITGMRERAILVGGSLSVSEAPKRGAEVMLQVPAAAVAQ